MKIDILKHTIVNACKSITYGMKKPDKKFFRTSLESMMEYQTTILSRMGDTTERSAAQTLKYLSYHLGKKVFQDLSIKVFHLLSRFVGDISRDSCICFDSVDINKYSAKQMEDLRKVRDGSTGNIVSGYVLNAVSIKGIPLLMERELLKDRDGNELTTRYDIFETQLQQIRAQFGSGYWILADRLYDDVKKYNLLITEGFRFAIRMKTTRYVTIEEVISLSVTSLSVTSLSVTSLSVTSISSETKGVVPVPGIKVQVKDLPEGHYKITFPGLQRACFLTVTLKKGMKNPIRVLSSESDLHTVQQYLKRWEIERIFKSGKQEFELESIGTQSKYKIDHLIALVQLSLGISAYMYNRLETEVITEECSGKRVQIATVKVKYLVFEGNNQNNKKAVVDATAFTKELKRYLTRVSKTFNRNSIICFIGDYMKKVRKIYWNLEKVTLKPQLSAQLSLGF